MPKKKESKSIKDLNDLRKAHSNLMNDVAKKNNLIKLHENLHMATFYHLSQCLETTGTVLKEDLIYCENLTQRIINHSK